MNMEDLYRLLRTGHVQAQGIVDTVGDPLIVLDTSLCVQNANRAFLEAFKVERDDTIGRPLFELGNGQWNIAPLRSLLCDVIPKSTAVINYEVEHVFPEIGRRVMLVAARTLFHPDGASHTMLVTIVDATERHRRDLAKDMLFGELRHRMKNMLGVARSIASQTTTQGRSAEEYREVFLGRFSALIDAEDLAFTEQGKAGVDEILARTLAPFLGSGQGVVIEPGPVVELSPSLIMSLSLVLHELATNAAKHGALSKAGGQVKVSRHLDDTSGRLQLEWVESGGPPVSPPASTGYGTRLIRATITYNLQGSVELDYAADGLRAEIVIPLGNGASA
jgi:two-component sensor histidine kinase